MLWLGVPRTGLRTTGLEGAQEERALEGALEEQRWLTWGTQETEGWTGPAEVKETQETMGTMEGWTGPAEPKETQDSFQEQILGLKPTLERALGLEPTLERALGMDSKTSHNTPPVFLGAHGWRA